LNKELFLVSLRYNPVVKGALSGRLKFKCGNITFICARNKEVLILHYQGELNPDLRQNHLAPGRSRFIKILPEASSIDSRPGIKSSCSRLGFKIR
jgi:hypothetical protein